MVPPYSAIKRQKSSVKSPSCCRIFTVPMKITFEFAYTSSWKQPPDVCGTYKKEVMCWFQLKAAITSPVSSRIPQGWQETSIYHCPAILPPFPGRSWPGARPHLCRSITPIKYTGPCFGQQRKYMKYAEGGEDREEGGKVTIPILEGRPRTRRQMYAPTNT